MTNNLDKITIIILFSCVLFQGFIIESMHKNFETEYKITERCSADFSSAVKSLNECLDLKTSYVGPPQLHVTLKNSVSKEYVEGTDKTVDGCIQDYMKGHPDYKYGDQPDLIASCKIPLK